MNTYLLLLTVSYIVIFSGCAEAQVTWTQLANLETPMSSRTISYGDADVQIIDVFEPAERSNGSVVMLIHGGCWLSQYDRFYMSHLAKSIAEKGSTVYNIGYRRVGDEGGGYPGTFDDVRAAYNAIVDNQHQQTGNRGEITIVGHSAGGHLALWLASTDTSVARVVGLAAISDLSDYARGTGSCQMAAPRLMGGSPDELQDLYSASDPMLLGKPRAEIVLISADKDAIVPPSHNDGFKTKTNARHVVLSGVGHFDLVAPMSSVWKEVLSVIGDR